jgi:hypothetical protein
VAYYQLRNEDKILKDCESCTYNKIVNSGTSTSSFVEHSENCTKCYCPEVYLRGVYRLTTSSIYEWVKKGGENNYVIERATPLVKYSIKLHVPRGKPAGKGKEEPLTLWQHDIWKEPKFNKEYRIEPTTLRDFKTKQQKRGYNVFDHMGERIGYCFEEEFKVKIKTYHSSVKLTPRGFNEEIIPRILPRTL